MFLMSVEGVAAHGHSTIFCIVPVSNSCFFLSPSLLMSCFICHLLVKEVYEYLPLILFRIQSALWLSNSQNRFSCVPWRRKPERFSILLINHLPSRTANYYYFFFASQIINKKLNITYSTVKLFIFLFIN